MNPRRSPAAGLSAAGGGWTCAGPAAAVRLAPPAAGAGGVRVCGEGERAPSRRGALLGYPRRC